jgi:hypothetical protein
MIHDIPIKGIKSARDENELKGEFSALQGSF